MIAEDVRIHELDPVQWANLWALASRPVAGRSRRPGPRGALTLLHDGERLLQAFGSVEVDPASLPFSGVGPESLRAVREAAGVRRVTAVDVRGVRRLFDRGQRAVRYDEDFIRQALAIYGAVRAEAEAVVRADPPRRKPLPAIDADWLERGARLLFSRPQTLAFYVFEGREPHASLILGFEKGDLTRVTTHDALAQRGFELQWGMDDAPRIAAEITRRFAPLRLGVFLTLETWDECRRGDEGGWLGAVASGRIALGPAPIPLAVLLRLLKLGWAVFSRD